MKMVDVPPKSKLGADWMMRGNRRVATPGQNRKHYLAGAHCAAGTGNVTYVASDSKGHGLVLVTAQTLKRTYRRAKEHHADPG